MKPFEKIMLSLLLTVTLTLCVSSAAPGEDLSTPSIKIRKVPDGIVVVANHNQAGLDENSFGCSQDGNAITVDLPQGHEQQIMQSLQKNPLVAKNGASLLLLPRQKTARFTIVPILQLDCAGARLVSKFQRYVTYFYPAGRAIHITATEVGGFDFDDNNPRGQVNGVISLKLNQPLGATELPSAVSVAGKTLTLRLNPKDFLGQQQLASLFTGHAVKAVVASSPLTGAHTIEFKTFNDADIANIAAKLVAAPGSDVLRIDISLAVSLYDAGKKSYEKGDVQKALRYLELAKSDPAYALVARMSLGTIFWNEDNFSEASRNFIDLIELDRSWEFPEARYFAAKSSFLAQKRLGFELSNRLKEFLRRCDHTRYATCDDARDFFDQVNEPSLKLNLVSKPEMKKLVAQLADPKLNYNEVQKNIFHYWATWCPVCLEEMPRIMQYAVAHPNINLYVVAKNDTPKNIMNSLLKAGAIKRKNIFYYIDSKDDILLRQMVPLILANKEPVTPLPISVFLQRELPFYLTDKLHWTEKELSDIWKIRYRE